MCTMNIMHTKPQYLKKNLSQHDLKILNLLREEMSTRACTNSGIFSLQKMSVDHTHCECSETESFWNEKMPESYAFHVRYLLFWFSQTACKKWKIFN